MDEVSNLCVLDKQRVYAALELEFKERRFRRGETHRQRKEQ